VRVWIFYDFFAGGFVSTFAGILKAIKRRDESTDVRTLIGLLSARRGIGAVVSGLLSEALLNQAMAKQSQCRVWVRAWEFDHFHRSYSRRWRSKLSGKEIGVDVIVFNGAWGPSVRLLQSVSLPFRCFLVCLEDITNSFCAGKADNDPWSI
jgi:hypothetical protein